jgi:hypothetical protein
VPQAATNRAAWVVIFGLALILIIAAIAVPPKTPPPPTPPPPPADARGIVLPADGVTRTVIVPACGSTSPTDPGYVRFQVGGGTTRAVLLPDCAPQANPAPGASQQVSAFVLPVGANVLIDRPAGVGLRQQVLVPNRAKARTIIVPACARGTTVRPNAKRQDVILSTATVSASAPAC